MSLPRQLVVLGALVLTIVGVLLVWAFRPSPPAVADGPPSAMAVPAEAGTDIAASPVSYPVADVPFPDSDLSLPVTVCGTSFCVGGKPWVMRATTIYGSLNDPAPVLALAKEAGFNTVRITDFFYFERSAAENLADPDVWDRLDKAMAAADDAGFRVIYDLSPWRNALIKDGLNPYAQDWGPYLDKALSRVSSVTGKPYVSDPSVVLISLAGEPEPPNGDKNPTVPSSEELTEFFAEYLPAVKELAPNALVSSGGLIQLDWDSGVDWEAIFVAPGSDICNIHVYNEDTRAKAVGKVAEFCTSKGLPWLLEEFGMRADNPDEARASWFSSLLGDVESLDGAGWGLWNTGFEQKSETYDVSPVYPKAWAAIVAGNEALAR